MHFSRDTSSNYVYAQWRYGNQVSQLGITAKGANLMQYNGSSWSTQWTMVKTNHFYNGTIEVTREGTTNVAFDKPADCSQVIGVTLRRAWPVDTWYNAILIVSNVQIASGGAKINVYFHATETQKFNIDAYLLYL